MLALLIRTVAARSQAAYEITGAKDGPKEVKRAPTNIIEKWSSVSKTKRVNSKFGLLRHCIY